MRILVALFLLCAVPAFAQQVDVPVISFEQQVNIVVTAKQDRNLLDVKFKQDKEDITLDVVVDKNVGKEKAKKIALNTVMIAKSKSLDDQPKKKDIPGKGLYNYTVNVTVPDGMALTTATKKKADENLSFEDPFQVEPTTRAGEAAR